MDGVAATIHYTTQALYQGSLGQWPAMSPAPGAIKPPRLPWFDTTKPGTMPLPGDTWGQDLRK